MAAVGIIAEFNPFHKGHAYLMEQAKKITGADCAVILMNGDFVQRGEPAITNKYDRTKAAMEGGADMVFELPVRFGISSAGDFALGGIMALNQLGFITHLAFGSESGDLASLQKIADILFAEPDSFQQSLRENLRKGLPFPAAREQALLAECPELSIDFLDQPNNILGIEYLLALKKTNSHIQPVTIPRLGLDYHQTNYEPDVFPSATHLRKEWIHREQPHLCFDDLTPILGYQLLQTPDLTIYKDFSADLSDRVKKNLSGFQNAEDFVQHIQSRTFTASRIRRSLLQCVLGLTGTEKTMPYLRLLGMDPVFSKKIQQVSPGCKILANLSRDVKKLTEREFLLFQKDLFASDLYRQLWNEKYHTTLPVEYQRSPYIRP